MKIIETNESRRDVIGNKYDDYAMKSAKYLGEIISSSRKLESSNVKSRNEINKINLPYSVFETLGSRQPWSAHIP